MKMYEKQQKNVWNPMQIDENKLLEKPVEINDKPTKINENR